MRSNPLPQREIDIGLRLRIWRETLGLSRSEMVEGMKVSPQKLAHVEEGNAPLRYDFARYLFAGFAISSEWLATGEGQTTVDGEHALPSAESIGISPRELFSSVYDEHLRKIKRKPKRAAGITTPQFDLDSKGARIAAHRWLERSFARWMETIPDIMITDFVHEIAQRAEELRSVYHKKADEIRRLSPKTTAEINGWDSAKDFALRAAVHRRKKTGK